MKEKSKKIIKEIVLFILLGGIFYIFLIMGRAIIHDIKKKQASGNK